MTPADWQQIADDIRVNYDKYDGFVILPTLWLTQLRLSFMLENLGKPVIVTGSQIPLAELRLMVKSICLMRSILQQITPSMR